MFSNFSDNLQKILKKLRSKGILSEKDIDEAMREIRLALIEADVALPVAREFIKIIKEKALGKEVLTSISPGQMVVKIVHDELLQLLEQDSSSFLDLRSSPATLMLVGLQGSGKTTSCAKLALRIRNKHQKKVLLVSTDIYRPAAQLQLESLAKQINLDSLPIIAQEQPIDIAKRALTHAAKIGAEVIVLDTAGRLQTDELLMKELQDLQELLQPSEVLLVSDAMIGQESINIAKTFQQYLGKITGIILTRIDGDTRGGVALSMKQVLGCPIKFMGVGEKVNELEEFHGERIASRILGMGDVVSLVEKASQTLSQEEADNMMQKLKKGKFDMNDLLTQMRSIKKMGNITSLISMIPGMGALKDKIDSSANEGMMRKTEAMICSMTTKERHDPTILNGPRKRRIALGSGTTINDVNILLKQYNEASKMIKKVGKMDNKQALRMFKNFGNGASIRQDFGKKSG